MAAKKDMTRLTKKYRKFAQSWCDRGSYSERVGKHGMKIKCSYSGKVVNIQFSGTPGSDHAVRRASAEISKLLQSVGRIDDWMRIKFISNDVGHGLRSSNKNERDSTLRSLWREVESVFQPYMKKVTYKRNGKTISYYKYFVWGVVESRGGKVSERFIQVDKERYRKLLSEKYF